MTERLFLADPELREAEATVLAAAADGVVLDRTPFYRPRRRPAGRWRRAALGWRRDGRSRRRSRARARRSATCRPTPRRCRRRAMRVVAALDWPRRWAHMRMHTTLHLLCAVLPGAAVTGGQVGADRSRLDFDLPGPPAREAIEAALNALIAADHPVTAEWVDESVLDDNPGTGPHALGQAAARHRAAAAGAHRRGRRRRSTCSPAAARMSPRTGAIGPVRVLKMESKGRQNRRIVVALAEGTLA